MLLQNAVMQLEVGETTPYVGAHYPSGDICSVDVLVMHEGKGINIVSGI